MQKQFLIILLASLIPQFALARWAKEEDMGSIDEFLREQYSIKKDGSYVYDVEQQVQILRDDARVSDGTMRFSYKPDSESFKVLEAFTLNKNERFTLPKENIEDKPLASAGDGFDQVNQVTLVFPNVDIGSKLYFRVKHTVNKVPIPRFFAEYFLWGGTLVKDYQGIIRSEVPLYTEKSDSLGSIKVSSSKVNGQYILEFKNTKPFIRRVMDEEESLFNPDQYPWMVVSTDQSWRYFAQSIILDHEKILKAPLPPSFITIANKAKTKKTTVEKINTITSELADLLRYHGDWRTVEGRYISRSLEKIATSRVADCKDFSASTAALLRFIGIDADIAWINRSEQPHWIPEKIPHTFFDHAIVRAEVDGKIYWVDATNVASFAQGIFEDIIDRQAFILNAKNPHIERTPAADPLTSSMTEEQTIDFSQKDPVVVGVAKFAGREGAYQAGWTREASKETAKRSMIEFLSRDFSFTEWKVKDVDLHDRVAKDFEVSYEFKPRQLTQRTSAGMGLKLPTPRRISGIARIAPDRVTDLFIAWPVVLKSVLRLKNIQTVGSVEPLQCKVESDWIHAKREIQVKDKETVVNDEITILKPTLNYKELSKSAVKTLQNQLLECFNSPTLIFNPAS